MSNEETILDEAKRLVFGDREREYAHPSIDGARFADLMNAYYGKRSDLRFTAADYPVIMVLCKLARLQNAYKRDTAVDIAGYAEVLARIMGDDK